MPEIVLVYTPKHPPFNLLFSAGFRRVPPGAAGFPRVPPRSNGCRRVPPGSAAFHRVRPGLGSDDGFPAPPAPLGSARFAPGCSLVSAKPTASPTQDPSQLLKIKYFFCNTILSWIVSSIECQIECQKICQTECQMGWIECHGGDHSKQSNCII